MRHSSTQLAPVRIPAGGTDLEGELAIPYEATGLVLFAHGSGSSRHSPRNHFVAEALNERQIGTLLFDLLSPEEEVVDMRTTHLRFDIALLAERLLYAIDWVAENEPRLPIGLFGASTGAGAALLAASHRPGKIAAIVSRGGRPDLAGAALPEVDAPTLLLVGGRDTQVIELNKTALVQLRCLKSLEIIPRATHLFEEPGALEEVAVLAREWFAHHMAAKVEQHK